MTKKKKAGFIDVDVTRARYGETSVKAVFSIYAKKFGKSPAEMRKTSFNECVAGLRELKAKEELNEG